MAASEAITNPGEISAEATAKPKRRLLPIMAIAVLLLVTVGGGVGAALHLGLLGGTESNAAAEAMPPPVFLELPEIVVRLEGGTGQYLKLAVVLDLKSEDARERIKMVQPRLLDSLQTYLVDLSPDDFKGTAGMYRVRQELLRRVNDTLPGTTFNVLFKTLILQ